MNGKKAKALRREAETLTKGMPKVSYRKYKPHAPIIEDRITIDDKTKLKEVYYFKVGDWDPIVMLHACTRNIYKLLKLSC